MKKDPVPALALSSPLQKMQRAPSSAAALRGPGPKASPGGVKGRQELAPPNNKTNNGGKSANGQPFDADRVLSALISLKKGDFDVRLPVGWTGIAGKVADTFNDVSDIKALSTT